MKIKSCYKYEGTDMIEILFEDFPYNLYCMRSNEIYWVAEYNNVSETQFQRTRFIDIPEKVLQDISDPLFEIKCLQEMSNPEKISGKFTESHDFSF